MYRWALKIEQPGKKYPKTQVFDTQEEAEVQRRVLLAQGKRERDLRIVQVDQYGQEK